MKKKGSFLSGLIVFILIIIILGGVGYLGYNIISNANGSMAGMNMVSDTKSTESGTTDSVTKDSVSDTSSASNSDSDMVMNDSTSGETASSYKINQINQVMMNKEELDKAFDTIETALEKMTLDPYAAETDMAMSNQGMKDDENSSSDEMDQGNNTTVNIYNGTSDQSMQMQNMGTTYDPDKMYQLHSGLYKVSVGMQLLKQLQDNIQTQIEQATIDTSSEAQYYLNQYYSTLQDKNKLTDALSYIDEAVELININPYIDANGAVYDSARMSELHDSIYIIAQGVVDLNKLSDDLLNQAVQVGNSAQSAYNTAQTSGTDNADAMNMSAGTSGSIFGSLNVSSFITFILIAFVIVFIVGLLGSIMNLFKSGKNGSEKSLE